MQIGELARKGGTSAQAIRFYERRRILPQPRRTSSGYRTYGPEDLDNLRVIQRCQHLGFTLKEIRDLLALHRKISTLPENRPGDMRQIADLARRRLEQLDGKLRALKQMRGQLLDMLARFDEPGCPAGPRR